MRRIRCILVAVKDPTAKSQPALAKAAQLARALDAALVSFQAMTRRNTAERVLDHLPCDLLVVKPSGFGGAVPRSRRGARYLSVRSGSVFS